MRYTGGPILIDGSPRSVDEAKTMKEFFCDFLGREVFVFYISVTDEECKRRILARNELHKTQNREVRADCSTVESITEKLRWFHTDVMPAIQYLEKAPGIYVYSIYSDQKTTPDQVHEQVMEYLR
jgi:adenylate kinase family enzyme